jgi:hypothetical protein
MGQFCERRGLRGSVSIQNVSSYRLAKPWHRRLLNIAHHCAVAPEVKWPLQIWVPRASWDKLLQVSLGFTPLTANGWTEEPSAAGTPEETIEFMMGRLEGRRFLLKGRA